MKAPKNIHHFDGEHFEKVVRNVKIPDNILKFVSMNDDIYDSTEIDVSGWDLPDWALEIGKEIGAQDTKWVYAAEVCPHTDPSWANEYFFTLIVHLENNPSTFFQAESATKFKTRTVRPGTFLVINPRRIHSMYGDRQAYCGVVCIQWEVKCRKAKDALQKLIGRLREMEGLQELDDQAIRDLEAQSR